MEQIPKRETKIDNLAEAIKIANNPIALADIVMSNIPYGSLITGHGFILSTLIKTKEGGKAFLGRVEETKNRILNSTTEEIRGNLISLFEDCINDPGFTVASKTTFIADALTETSGLRAKLQELREANSVKKITPPQTTTSFNGEERIITPPKKLGEENFAPQETAMESKRVLVGALIEEIEKKGDVKGSTGTTYSVEDLTQQVSSFSALPEPKYLNTLTNNGVFGPNNVGLRDRVREIYGFEKPEKAVGVGSGFRNNGNVEVGEERLFSNKSIEEVPTTEQKFQDLYEKLRKKGKESGVNVENQIKKIEEIRIDPSKIDHLNKTPNIKKKVEEFLNI